MTRVLGVDLGSERTGIAVGSFGVAHPLTVVEASDDEVIVTQIARYARDEGVGLIVIGLAISLDGTEGPAAKRQRAVSAMVEQATGAQVRLWDERLTTAEADRALLGAGLRRKERRRVVDKVAASILLQNYLDAQSSGAASP